MQAPFALGRFFPGAPAHGDPQPKLGHQPLCLGDIGFNLLKNALWHGQTKVTQGTVERTRTASLMSSISRMSARCALSMSLRQRAGTRAQVRCARPRRRRGGFSRTPTRVLARSPSANADPPPFMAMSEAITGDGPPIGCRLASPLVLRDSSFDNGFLRASRGCGRTSCPSASMMS